LPFGGALILTCRILFILVLCSACATKQVERNRSLASLNPILSFNDCALSVVRIKNMQDGVLYEKVDPFTLEYKDEFELLKKVDMFEELGVGYQILRVEFPKSYSYKKGIRILVNDGGNTTETMATYNRHYNWIILEDQFLELFRTGDKDNWIPFLSHELRHAFFEEKRRRLGFLAYRSDITNEGKVSDVIYDEYLSAEESYNYVKQFQSHLGRFYKAKRNNDFETAIKMMDSLESAADYGRENIKRFIAIYYKAQKLTPKLKIEIDGNHRYVYAEYMIDGERLRVPLKNIAKDIEESSLLLGKWRATIQATIEDNLEIFKGDLSRLNQMADDSGLGI
jgi:hypothetical protein